MKKKILLNFGLLILALQSIMLFYFNLFTLQTHIGYDSSWALLKAVLVWKEKSFVSDIWVDQTTLLLDSSLPLASLFYGLIDNIFIAYGLSNIVVIILLLYTLVAILKSLEIENEAIVIVLNICICPFLLNGFSVVNDSSYFSNVLSGPSFYAIRILTYLLIIYSYLMILKNRRFNKMSIISYSLVVLCSISSGVYLFVVAIIPYVIHRVKILLDDINFKNLMCIENIYGYLLIVSVLLGKFIAKYFLGGTSNDTGKTWSSIKDVFDNFFSVIQGFLKILTVLPVSYNGELIVTLHGITRCFSILLFIILIISVYKSFTEFEEEDYKNKIRNLLNVVVLFNCLLFSLFNVRYGSELFEERYLVIALFSIIIILAMYINTIKDTRIFHNIICFLLLFSIMIIDFQSDRIYIKNKNDYGLMRQIQTLADSEDAGLVYILGSNNIVLARNMRVVDTTRVYKAIQDDGKIHHWGDYKYYDDSNQYKGNILYIANSNSKNKLVKFKKTLNL